jgi:hypothetical protein
MKLKKIFLENFFSIFLNNKHQKFMKIYNEFLTGISEQTARVFFFLKKI